MERPPRRGFADSFSHVCDGLLKSFWRVKALNGVQLEVPSGSIFALIGPNGAGKTTLLKILLNIVRRF